MSRGDETDVVSTWKRAYYETPERVRRLIGFAIFVAQAFFSFVITQSRSFFLTRPTLTVGLISGFVILCLFGIVYGLARQIEESETDQREQTTSSEEAAPFTSLQLTVIEQIVTETIRRERHERYPSRSEDPQNLESESDDLRERVEDVERIEMMTEEISSLESEVQENRDFIRTVYRNMGQNADNFDPPQAEAGSEKNQDDTPSSTTREATESERKHE